MVQAISVIARAKLHVERARSRYGLIDVVVATFKRYSVDDAGSYAAALTYYIFFAIFPMLLFAVALLGYLTFLNPELKKDIYEAGIDSFPMLEQLLGTRAGFVQEQKATMAVTSVLLALYAGSGGVVAFQHSLNKVWHVQTEPNFIGKRIRSLKWLVIFALGALVTAALGAIGGFADHMFGKGSAAAGLVAALASAGGIAVGIGLFLTAFKYLPARSGAWRELLPGALFAGIAFELLKVVGSVYLGGALQARKATFGAFAAAAGLLVASYLLAKVILLAAELNAVLAERRATRQSSVPAQAGEAMT